jgi:hypothetical protein
VAESLIRYAPAAGSKQLQQHPEILAETLTHLAEARRELLLFSRELDAAVFNDADILQTIKDFARSSRFSDMRVLVQDSRPAQQMRHGLIPLARRLSSSIRIHRTPAYYHDHPEDFLLLDGRHYMVWRYQPHPLVLSGLQDPTSGRSMRDFFMEVWEQSEPDPELRSLHI